MNSGPVWVGVGLGEGGEHVWCGIDQSMPVLGEKNAMKLDSEVNLFSRCSTRCEADKRSVEGS